MADFSKIATPSLPYTRLMKRTHRLLLTVALAVCWLSAADGPDQILHDDLLANMAGAWKLTGAIRGRSAEHSVDAHWVLNHQFLQIEEDGGSSYQALVMVGYDHASERYVAHWMDVYGGRFSETLGFGVRSGDQIEFVFEYPDGPFHTIFRWLPDKREWQWLMKAKDPATKDPAKRWTDFANVRLAKAGR